MNKKKYLLYSVILSSFLVSCGNNGDKNTQNTISQNRTDNTTSGIMIGEDYKDLTYDPVVQVFNERKKVLKNVSSAQLALVHGKCDGKDLTQTQCVEKNISFRKANIPKENLSAKTVGSVLTEIKNSRICLDLNDDNLCGWDEPLAVTTDKFNFVLKLTEEQKRDKTHKIIAVRGVNASSNKNEITILKGENEDGVVLSPFSTFKIVNPSKNLDNIFPSINGSDKLQKYKDALILQKTIDILVSSYDLKKDKDIINKDIELYKLLGDNLSTSLKDTVNALSNTYVNNAKKAVKKLIDQVNAITLTQENKEALVIVLNDRLSDAKEHFRKNSGELILEPINADTLVYDAIKSMLEDIGVEGIDDTMINGIKDYISNNPLKISDLENLEKVSKAEESNKAFTNLKIQLEKKANATSELLILKALVVGNKLEIYYSENDDLKLSDESKEYLNGTNKTTEEKKYIIRKVYTIEGLEYDVKDISFDSQISKHTITFENEPTFKDGEKRLSINYLALKDSKGKYTKEKRAYSRIETLRSIPSTGQKLVWEKGDDASLGYGEDIKYKKLQSSDVVWTNEYTNLMWQDAPYEEGQNDVVTYGDAINYCENLTYCQTKW